MPGVVVVRVAPSPNVQSQLIGVAVMRDLGAEDRRREDRRLRRLPAEKAVGTLTSVCGAGSARTANLGSGRRWKSVAHLGDHAADGRHARVVRTEAEAAGLLHPRPDRLRRRLDDHARPPVPDPVAGLVLRRAAQRRGGAEVAAVPVVAGAGGRHGLLDAVVLVAADGGAGRAGSPRPGTFSLTPRVPPTSSVAPSPVTGHVADRTVGGSSHGSGARAGVAERGMPRQAAISSSKRGAIIARRSSGQRVAATSRTGVDQDQLRSDLLERGSVPAAVLPSACYLRVAEPS